MTQIPFVKKRDLIIILSILGFAIFFMILPYLNSNKPFAEISIDNKIVDKIELTKNSTFEINNIMFEVKDGEIKVFHSPCHDKICERTGFISKPGQVIVCLPEKLVVKIVCADSGSDLVVG